MVVGGGFVEAEYVAQHGPEKRVEQVSLRKDGR